MAFKRSAVRSRLSPPLQKRLTEALSQESTSLSLLEKKLTMYLENWTLWLWCNYEKATVKEIFSQFQFQNWEGKNTIFAKEKLLETWACIIQLIENRLDYLLIDYKSKAQRKRVLIWEEEQRSGVKFSALAGNGMKRMLIPTRSSYKERKGNALASGADEGRDKLR